MNEWTSRDGDMQLHTHCLVLNRAETSVDGRWRALDGRCLLGARAGAGALYNRVLEAELTRRLGVAWRERPDGLREIAGIDDEVIELFSTRRRHITAEVDEMIAAYRDRHGVEPPPAVVSSMAQQATLRTRRRKETLAPDEALDTWEATARAHGRILRDLPSRVADAARRQQPTNGSDHPDRDVSMVLQRLETLPRATFSDHDLLRVALDVTDPTGRSASEVRRDGEALARHVMQARDLVAVTAPDPIEVGDGLRRDDGSSVFDRPGRRRWALQSTLSQEAWLLHVATEPCGHGLPGDLLDEAATAHDLGRDQSAAVRDLLATDQRIGLLVGPAGTGKTRTLRAIADAWQTDGGAVLGLTVSQSAAAVLADETGVRTENTAKWLHESRRGRWQLPERPLLLVDEASMVATTELVSLVDQVRAADGKVLLVGDPAQLSAIHVGGAFDLLADRHGATRLHEVRRFDWPWEREASQRLRSRDPGALAAYAMRSRIRGGRLTEVEEDLFRAWRDDAVTHAGTDESRRTVLMVVATNEQVGLLGERARRELIDAGVVAPGPTIDVRHGMASRGDHLVTRRNARDLVTSTGRFVVNGDVWTVEQVHADGSATVRSHDDHGTVTLAADYLVAHTHLAYATTAHRAQGMTVDRSHALVVGDMPHELVYVAATRGRESNHLWVAVDSGTDEVRDADDLPTPEHVLASILARRDPDRLSAHQVIEDSQHEMGSLARLGAIFEDLARVTTERWVAGQAATFGLDKLEEDGHWPALVARVRQLALDGHDVEALMDRALAARPWGDEIASQAAVLHWRLGALAASSAPGRARGPLGSLPPVAGPEHDVAVQVGELIRERWRQIRADLSLVSVATGATRRTRTKASQPQRPERVADGSNRRHRLPRTLRARPARPAPWPSPLRISPRRSCSLGPCAAPLRRPPRSRPVPASGRAAGHPRESLARHTRGTHLVRPVRTRRGNRLQSHQRVPHRCRGQGARLPGAAEGRRRGPRAPPTRTRSTEPPSSPRTATGSAPAMSAATARESPLCAGRSAPHERPSAHSAHERTAEVDDTRDSQTAVREQRSRRFGSTSRTDA